MWWKILSDRTYRQVEFTCARNAFYFRNGALGGLREEVSKLKVGH